MPWRFWKNGTRTAAVIRLAGMSALIDVLGLVEAERFIAAVSRDRFDYTEWRHQCLPVWGWMNWQSRRIFCLNNLIKLVELERYS